MPYPDTS